MNRKGSSDNHLFHVGKSLAVAVIYLALGTCSGCYPGIQTNPDDPIFHPAIESSMCSLASLGLDIETVFSGTKSPRGDDECDSRTILSTVPDELACRLINTDQGPVRVYVGAPQGATGVVVFFTGLALPTNGEVTRSFATVARSLGLAIVAIDRDDEARPFNPDPLREAKRGILAGRTVANWLGLGDSSPSYIGVSMGGLEALLAGREDPNSRVAVLDAVLDPAQVAEHLDRRWSLDPAAAGMRSYFQRLLLDHYAETKGTSFGTWMARAKEGSSDLLRDAPALWLREIPRDDWHRFYIVASSADPALGSKNLEPLLRAGFPVHRLTVSGHVPIACEPTLVADMVEWSVMSTSGSAEFAGSR